MAGENVGLDLASQTGQEDIASAITSLLSALGNISGVQGPKGDTGDTGPKGDKGDKGDTGEQGPKGDKGDKGDTGAKGDKGDTGNKGDQGIQGVQGETGNGIVSIEKTSTAGSVDTYTITMTDGTTATFTVTNGSGAVDSVNNKTGNVELGIDDIPQLKNALPTKAEQDGAYPDLTAGQMLSKNESSDSVPYNFRAVGHDATLEYTDAIVGGSVVRNQLEQTSAWTVSQNANTRHDLYDNCLKNHVYLALAIQETTITSVTRNTFYYYEPSTDRYTFESSTENYSLQKGNRAWMVKAANDGKIVLWTNGASADVSYNNAMLIDLTQMFGTAIADFLYSLGGEVGGAWLKKRFPKLFEYQPYNAGEIVSVQGLSQHVTVGFNQWDEEWEIGDWYLGNKVAGSNNTIRCKNPIKVLPNTTYFYASSNAAKIVEFLGYDKQYLSRMQLSRNTAFTTPVDAFYVVFSVVSLYGTTYNHDICINLSCDRNGEYEPYIKRTYPLDDSLTLRGIPKLTDSNGTGDLLSIIDSINLRYDGDRYLPDGTVQRRYGEYAVTGNENIIVQGTNENTTVFRIVTNKVNAGNANQMSNYGNYFSQAWTSMEKRPNTFVLGGEGNLYVQLPTSIASTVEQFSALVASKPLKVVYELATPTTEEADPYTVPQIINPNGTEEYVSTSIVPVGHESRYPLDIAGRLDKILTMPTANGTYTLRATVNNGTVTYAWVSTS